ncbi:hypothetical protein [Psychromonas sp. MME2]|uniref:antibiotic biosynthesis monooxygenase family protein n=1 Tax=unclassified Psychromonas TaxID=2614957 RepID=UPI00339C283D
MYTVLYRWNIHHHKHDDFIAGWKAVTDHYLTNHGSLGARLHKVSDDSFAAYTQWESKEARDTALNLNDAPQDAVDKMHESIIVSKAPIEMTIISDQLK